MRRRASRRVSAEGSDFKGVLPTNTTVNRAFDNKLSNHMHNCAVGR